jgi:energy-coupling factor transport system ATP-binding protein
MSIISIKNLIHNFVKTNDSGEKIGTFSAVNDVSLDVEKGDFIAILGHNGSGKSTLAKHINALLYPTEGKVYVNDEDTTIENNILSIRSTAGMVFQNPDNQIIATVVEEDVAFGPENLGVPTDEIRIRVDDALKAVKMTEYREHSPNKLSGGQKQRVAIAGVLAMQPACIILDEPTAMLDPVGRREVIATVKKLNKKINMTVILVTHHMDEVIEADKVYIMDHGKIAMSGTPREVFNHVEEVKELGLDVPQVTEVSYMLEKEGYNIKPVLSIDEFINSNLGALSSNPYQDNDKLIGESKHTNSTDSKLSIHLKSLVGYKDETNEKEEGQNDNYNVISAKDSNINDNSAESLIELKDVTYTYGAGTAYEKTALKNVNIKINSGEFIALIGHTGSGKSTLIQHLNALEKPTCGSVLFKGEDINGEDYDRRKLRTKVGLVFQYPDHQLFEMSIIKDVEFGPKNQGLSDEEARERAEWALRLVGVKEENWEDSPFDLSGGQKKRVTIAGVLAMKPEVLILDEPTAGLDPIGRDEILGEIKKIYDETKITVILVSHSMEDVANYAGRIIVMNHGSVAFDDTPVNVFHNYKELDAIGLAVPQVTELCHRLNSSGITINTDIITVKDCIKELKKHLP